MVTPAGIPPPVNPNDPGRGPMAVAVTWVFTILAMMTTAMWFWARKKRNMSPGWDCWIMMIATVSDYHVQILAPKARAISMRPNRQNVFSSQLTLWVVNKIDFSMHYHIFSKIWAWKARQRLVAMGSNSDSQMELDSASWCGGHGCARANFSHHPTHSPLWNRVPMVHVVFDRYHNDTDY
jgi:hypothetical protein